MARRNSKKREDINKDNLQDAAMDQEFDKGFRSGKSSGRKPSRSKSGKSNNSSKSSKTKRIATGTAPIIGVKEGNDISWHNPNQNMFDGATGITFNASVGLPLITAPPSGNTINGWKGEDVKSPGIMAMYFIPSMGVADNGNSPVNTAMTSLFQYIRRNKSGSEIYQPADVGMMIGALDSAYMFYEFCCKVYGMSQDINVYNWYVPEAMLAAHGVNFKSVSRNLADFRYWISQYALRLRGFFVPKGIHLFDRHNYMVRGLFTDSSTNKAQYYAFVPTHYLQFSEGTEAAPFSALNYVQLVNPATMGAANPDNWLTVEQLMDFGDSLIEPLLQSESIRNIIADMLTAFPENGSYSIGDIPQDYVVKPMYDQQILMQFENAYMYGYGNTVTGGYSQVTSINNSYMTSTLQITPNDTPVTTRVNANTWNTIQVFRDILNFHHDNPSKEDIMYASRLAGFGFDGPVDEDGGPNDAQKLKTHGSEVATTCTMWYYSYSVENNPTSPRQLSSFTLQTNVFANLGSATLANNVFSLTAPGALGTFSTTISHLSQLAKFDWHPKFRIIEYFIYDDGTVTFTPQLQRSDEIFDIDTFALITEQQLQQMNEVSLLGLLICRDMGAYSNEITS